MTTNKKNNRIRRHRRVRAKVQGTAQRPRLAVFRSNKHLHLQLIDDLAGKTLAAASTVKDKDAVRALMERAQKIGVKQAVFDRGGFQYHGRVRTIAERLRKEGLKI
jgi:large subunit ribosomal protein L18